jgi:hypothetical protein
MTIDPRKPRELARGAFTKDNSEYLDEYLQAIRENWKDITSAANRTITRMLLAAGTFELVVRAASKKITIFGLEVTDLTLIRAALPVIVAYLFFELCFLIQLRNNYYEVHNSIIQDVYSHIYDRDLHALLEPGKSTLFGPRFLYPPNTPILNFMIVTLPRIYQVGILAFEFYAFSRQFRLPDSAPVTWIALVLTVYFLFYGFYIFRKS